MKALGTGWQRGITWRDFEVFNSSSGKPGLKLTGKALEIYRSLGGGNIVISITHTSTYALAEVIVKQSSRAATIRQLTKMSAVGNRSAWWDPAGSVVRYADHLHFKPAILTRISRLAGKPFAGDQHIQEMIAQCDSGGGP